LSLITSACAELDAALASSLVLDAVLASSEKLDLVAASTVNPGTALKNVLLFISFSNLCFI
jgi:hypothetical protein